MPLKDRPRSRVLQEPAPVASRERPTAEDLVKKAAALDPEPPLDESDDEGLAEQGTSDTPTDITDDGDEDESTTAPAVGHVPDHGMPVGGTSHKANDEEGNQSAPAPARRGRAARVATTPVDDSDPKPRMSDIQREVKQLRSEYTTEIKRIEAVYGEKLKALRAEYDVLNAQAIAQAFTL